MRSTAACSASQGNALLEGLADAAGCSRWMPSRKRRREREPVEDRREEQPFAQGDELRADGRHKDALVRYKQALSKAEGA
jgi:hypothetical protein